jgi:DNA-binding winged helix-turn-helix (wHTH) protein/tetratricopeptide (TPR) repeat protein
MDAAVTPQRRIDLATERPFHVGHASVDPMCREAIFDGGKERLQPQNLKVLIALAERRDRVVTREELVERCWQARFVADDVINRSISTLRRFAQRAGGFEIETIPRAGYRLVETQGSRSRVERRWATCATALALLIVAAGWYLQHDRGGTSEATAPTVAILPISADSSARDVRDLAAATRASLSYALTRGGYPVVLVESPAMKRRPDLLISGDVQGAGSSIHAFVQVEEVRHGVIVYSHRFDGTNTLPDQIGASVATDLSRASKLMMLDRRHPSDPAITSQLLNAESQGVDSGDKLQAYEAARRVAPEAPNSAIAQFTLASDTGASLDELPRDQRPAALAAGRLAADRVRRLAPDYAEAYGLWCSLHSPVYLRQCEDWVRKGLAADPNSPSGSASLGTLLNAVGRIDESLQLNQISLAEDPLNPFELGRMLRLLEEEGRTADAERLFRQSIRWWPNHWVIYWSRLVGIESRGDYSELERFEGEVDVDKLPLDRNTAAKVILAVHAHDRSGILGACAVDGLRWTTQFLCMTALADAGDLNRAFIFANRLFPPVRGRDAADEEQIWLDQPSGFTVAVLSSPAVASLRRDARFLKLAEGAGLLEYWRDGRLPDFCTHGHEAVCGKIVNPH